MKRVTRVRLGVIGVALSLLVGIVVADVATVRAVSCYGHGCDGRSPVSTGCNRNAFLAKRYVIKDMRYGLALWQAYADVYYSRSCGTNWLRVSKNEFGGAAYKTISSLRSNGSTMYREAEIDYGYGSSYSMMVYAPGSTKISFYAKLFDRAQHAKAWTGIHTLQ